MLRYLDITHANKKESMAHTHTLTKTSMQTVPEEAQVLYLLDKIFKSAFKYVQKSKEITSKAAKEKTADQESPPPHPHRNTDFMTDDFPYLQGAHISRKMNTQTHKVQRTKNRLNIRKSSMRRIKTKLFKVKDRILKAAREKLLTTYKGAPTRL